MKRQQGSILILVMLAAVLVGGMAAAVLTTTLSYHRSSRETFDRELAYRCAESGAAHYLLQLMSRPNYFMLNPAPHAAREIGGGTFELLSAESVGAKTWQLLLNATYDGVTFRLSTVIGSKRIPFPVGVVVVGTGKASDVVFQLKTKSTLGSYDPAEGPYDPSAPGPDGSIGANGSLSITGGSTINGDASGTGTVSKDGTSTITGETTEYSAETPVEDIDPIVQNAMSSSKTSNNNALLAGIFGSQCKPVVSSENYVDLVVTTKATYVIPAGVYRFRRFEVHNGATVVFDTSGGPSQLAYVGSGKGTGILNDLTLDGGSGVKVNPKGSANGLLTILGTDCDFKVSGSAAFGQAIGDLNNGGYSQIISLGGDTSSDDIIVSGGAKVYGRLYAAAHSLTMSQSSRWYGSALARSVSISESLFAVDEGVTGRALTHPSEIAILAGWPATP